MLIYLSIFLLLLELGYFKIADKLNIVDKPNQRSSHTQVTLRGGGIIFLLGSLLYSLFFGFNYPYFLLGLLIISIISFVDDIKSLSIKARLVVQFLAILLMYIEWGLFNSSLNITNVLILLFVLILCIGTINIYNFMDGINGITGGYSLIVILAMILLNKSINFIDNDLLIVVILSLIVFCIFNFRSKAKCFAGDIGSVGIAFIILFSLGKLIISTEDFTYLVFLAVYIVDSGLTIVHRLQLHENIGIPHRKHVYQIMANELKIPHIKVSLTYMIVQLFISLGKIYLPIDKSLYFVITFLILGIIYVIFISKFYHLHTTK